MNMYYLSSLWCKATFYTETRQNFNCNLLWQQWRVLELYIGVRKRVQSCFQSCHLRTVVETRRWMFSEVNNAVTEKFTFVWRFVSCLQNLSLVIINHCTVQEGQEIKVSRCQQSELKKSLILFHGHLCQVSWELLFVIFHQLILITSTSFMEYLEYIICSDYKGIFQWKDWIREEEYFTFRFCKGTKGWSGWSWIYTSC